MRLKLYVTHSTHFCQYIKIHERQWKGHVPQICDATWDNEGDTLVSGGTAPSWGIIAPSLRTCFERRRYFLSSPGFKNYEWYYWFLRHTVRFLFNCPRLKTRKVILKDFQSSSAFFDLESQSLPPLLTRPLIRNVHCFNCWFDAWIARRCFVIIISCQGGKTTIIRLQTSRSGSAERRRQRDQGDSWIKIVSPLSKQFPYWVLVSQKHAM